MRSLALFVSARVAALTLFAALLGVLPPLTVEADAASGFRRILLAGDSITHGSNGDYTWRYRLFKKLQSTAAGNFEFVGPTSTLYDHHDGLTPSSNYLVSNFAGKRHAAKWGTTFHEQVPLIEGNVRSSNANVLVVLLGSNDFTFRNASPESVIQLLKTYVQNARKANPQIDIVVGEVLTKWNHFGPSETLVAETQRFKALLPATVASLNTASSRVVAAPTLNGWAPHAHTWDGAHPNAAGETLIAQRVSEGLAAVGVGSASPNIYNPNQRWSQVAPAPTITTAPEQATMSWNLKPTGATGMYLNYKVDVPGQSWVHLPYPVGTNASNPSQSNRWTLTGLVGGAQYHFALIAGKGTTPSDKFGPITSRVMPGITPDRPTNVKTAQAADGLYGQQIKLSWTPPKFPNGDPQAFGYMLSFKTFPQRNPPRNLPEWTELHYPLVGGMKSEWHFTGLETGRRYKFRTRAIRGLMESPPATGNLIRSKGLPRHVRFVVLGDSYASGIGRHTQMQKYDPHRGEENAGNNCYRTKSGWAGQALSDLQPSVDLLACSGAKAKSDPGDPPGKSVYKSQRVTAMNKGQYGRTEIVALSFGGNDAGFSSLLIDCSNPLGFCRSAEDQARHQRDLTRAGGRLEDIYLDARVSFPYADVIAMGYPSPIGDLGSGPWVPAPINPLNICSHLVDDAAYVWALTTQFNEIISSAAKRVGQGVLHGAGQMTQEAFRHHGACNRDPWITNISFTLGWDWPPADISQSFHPNETGHYYYAVAFNNFVIGNVK